MRLKFQYINLFKAWLFLYVPQGLTFRNSTWRSFCIERFVRISEQTATFALYSINWLVFITVVGSVYCAVRTDCLYKADYVSSLKALIDWCMLWRGICSREVGKSFYKPVTWNLSFAGSLVVLRYASSRTRI